MKIYELYHKILKSEGKMTIYGLFEKAFEENLANEQIRQNFVKEKKKIISKKLEQLGDYANTNVSKNLLDAKMAELEKEANLELRELKKACAHAQKSDYAKMLLKMKDETKISNEKLCKLLKNNTGVAWSHKIEKSENGQTAQLIFESAQTPARSFVAQEVLLDENEDFSVAQQRLNNINWFEEYFFAEKTKSDENKMSYTLLSGQRSILPQAIKESLEEVFQETLVPKKFLENGTKSKD